MLIQSTGQGETHKPHPVQKALITICICLAAPMIASNGQASKHLVQPMHSFSLIIASLGIIFFDESS